MVLNKVITFCANARLASLRTKGIYRIVEARNAVVRFQLSFGATALVVALGIPAVAQGAPESFQPVPQTPTSAAPTVLQENTAPSQAVRMLENFKDSDIKFDLDELLDTLRDHRHEGWVLTAYPDPKTGQPLIGAGFSLDLPAREHPQLDPLNPHAFLEPSSAELWQAAGFDGARLDEILNVFHQRTSEWSTRTWRRQMMGLPSQITDDEAMQLVRVGAIQSIYNARAYCRNFDQLTGPQQMALTQLVYQMGVNLEEFSQFLALINPGAGPRTAAVDPAVLSQDGPVALDQTPAYWKNVQKSLIESQWARLYRTRAISVIAMLDPAYGDSPSAAERRVGATLRPAVVHRRKGHAPAIRQVTSTRHSGHARRAGRPVAHARSRKRA